MTDINHIINLNVQLEGLLKVLAERDSVHARSMLAEKYKEYTALLDEFLAAPSAGSASDVRRAAESLAADAHYVEVKDQEAQEAEDVDEDDAAAAAIARGEHRAEARAEAAANTVAKAFTLNDKFRFVRDVFGGNERDFDDTVALLADMATYDEAADYIYNDMMLDPENADVADFMAVVRRNIGA